MPAHGARRGTNQERGRLLSFELVESLHGVSQAVFEIRNLIRWIREQVVPKLDSTAFPWALMSAPW